MESSFSQHFLILFLAASTSTSAGTPTGIGTSLLCDSRRYKGQGLTEAPTEQSGTMRRASGRIQAFNYEFNYSLMIFSDEVVAVT